MNAFPAVDPIPLPAPVWLFKALHVLTLALHFYAVEMLLGGLLIATWLNLSGKWGGAGGATRLDAAASLSKRLPVVMTYVINLGVPPLLFAQVLYGRAIYTSSVLIGVWWIAVIFLLMGCYWHIYRFNAKVEKGVRAWPMALVGWLLAIAIAKIYSTNMTLMIRPEVWQAMYAKSAFGLHLPPHDPTLMPRWLFMVVGGLAAGGLWMLWLAGRTHIEANVRGLLAGTGGRLAAVAILAQMGLAYWVFRMQPAAVADGLQAQPLYRVAAWVWAGGAALLLLIALASGLRRSAGGGTGWAILGLGLATMLAMALYRDGIRDLTLLSKGFDVWQRQVVTNWTIVGLFLALFVAGLGGMAWLISIVMRARPVSEKVTG